MNTLILQQAILKLIFYIAFYRLLAPENFFRKGMIVASGNQTACYRLDSCFTALCTPNTSLVNITCATDYGLLPIAEILFFLSLMCCFLNLLLVYFNKLLMTCLLVQLAIDFCLLIIICVLFGFDFSAQILILLNTIATGNYIYVTKSIRVSNDSE